MFQLLVHVLFYLSITHCQCLPSSRLTKPGEIDSDFFAEVVAYVIKRLVLVPLAPTPPVLQQDLARIQALRVQQVLGYFGWSLNRNINLAILNLHFIANVT